MSNICKAILNNNFQELYNVLLHSSVNLKLVTDLETGHL